MIMIPDFHEFDWILVNSSSGKDSQTLLHQVIRIAIEQGIHLARIVVAHADLGRLEWPGSRELAEAQARHYGLRFEVAKRHQGDLLQQIMDRLDTVRARGERYQSAADGDLLALTLKDRTKADKKAEQTGLELGPELYEAMAKTDRENPIWPGSTSRFCTSDHKRGPLRTIYTKLAREFREQHPEHGPVKILNCMGMRAEESPARAKMEPYSFCASASTQKTKQIWDWLTIQDWPLEEVWSDIRQSGVQHHWAYDIGMPRLSCILCVFAPKDALTLAGRHNPELLQQYVELEEEIGYAFRQKLSLKEIQQDIEAGQEIEIGDRNGTWNM